MSRNHKSAGAASNPEHYERIKSVLQRYPGITPEEKAEVLLFLSKGPMLERALLSGVQELQPQLAQFTKDHKKAFALGSRDYFIIALIVVGVLAGFVLLWDAAL